MIEERELLINFSDREIERELLINLSKEREDRDETWEKREIHRQIEFSHLFAVSSVLAEACFHACENVLKKRTTRFVS